ncbi:MAG: diacylglycerol/polyprenol kinase family protein [Sandaracinaceae bacterium]
MLSDIDPARWNSGAADAVRQRLGELRERLGALRTRLSERKKPQPADVTLGRTLEELDARLAEAPDPDMTMASAQAHWMAFKASMFPSYEALRRALRDYEIHVPSLRPTNYRRNLTHVASALGCAAILWAVPSPAWAIAIAVPACLMAWTAEFSRRRSARVNAWLMRVLSPIAHPHEHHRVNSATWYTTALALLALSREPLAAAVGLAVLGLGDPAAALVGRRFGRIKLRHGRTLEGTLAFVAVGIFGALGAVYAFAPETPLLAAVAIAGAGAVAGSIAELLSLRVDDNLSIPLTAAAATFAAATFF